MTARSPASPGGLLDAIGAAVRTRVARRRELAPLAAVAQAAECREPRGGWFREAIGRPGRVNVIAECKRRSPARGVLSQSYRPADRARAYEAGGAAAISVLTEPAFFDGALAHLDDVRQAANLPILRKDFIVDEYQLFETRAAGADAVLLIVSLLESEELRRLMGRAAGLALATLVEVHTREELDEAASAGASIIGVNSRNLQTLDVDLAVCDALIDRAPKDAVMVAESGVRTAAEIDRLRARGYGAFLIGERLMREVDPRAALESLVRNGPRSGRGGDLEVS